MRKMQVAMAALLVTVLGACSDGAPSVAPIDISKLDIGNYPTEPLDVETLRNPSSGFVREAIAIGNKTPVPFEYDSRFAHGPDYPRNQIVTPDEPPYPEAFGIKLPRKDFGTNFPGLVAGWHNYATRRFDSTMGRILDSHTMRFDSPESARNAADKMSELAPGVLYSVDGYSTAKTKVTPAEPSVSAKMRSWLVRDDMLLYLQIADSVSRPFNEVDNAGIVKRFFDNQIEQLKGYSRTPLDKIAQLPLDADNLLSRTLPADKTSSRATVYPAHAALSISHTPVATAAAYADAGVDLVVLAGAYVYRAKDAAAAERLSAAYGSDALSPGRSTKEVEPPPNLPTATCTAGDSELQLPPSCRFTVGRYLVRVAGPNLQDTYQRAGAQYRLLANLN